MNNDRTGAAVALNAFLEANGVTFEDAARALGTHKSAVFQWAHGPGRPRVEFRTAIARWTKGAVKVDDWLTDDEQERASGVVPFRTAKRAHSGAR